MAITSLSFFHFVEKHERADLCTGLMTVDLDGQRPFQIQARFESYLKSRLPRRANKSCCSC